MKKTISIAMDNLRRSVNTKDSIPSAAARWGTAEITNGADGGSADGDASIPDSGLPTSDGGSSGSNQELGCMPPPPAIPLIDDPRTSDEIGIGRDVFERLTRSGSTYLPSLRVDFYRAVWFDGLEAYNPLHYTVGSSKAVIPATTLSTDVQVSARYVVR